MAPAATARRFPNRPLSHSQHHSRLGDRACLNVLSGPPSPDRHADALNLSLATGIFYGKCHHIYPSEIGPRSVKSNESWHFERQALLIVGRRYLAALDRDLAMLRGCGQLYRGQRPGSAVRLDVDIDPNPDVRIPLPIYSAIDRLKLRKCSRAKCEKRIASAKREPILRARNEAPCFSPALVPLICIGRDTK